MTIRLKYIAMYIYVNRIAKYRAVKYIDVYLYSDIFTNRVVNLYMYYAFLICCQTFYKFRDIHRLINECYYVPTSIKSNYVQQLDHDAIY